MPIFKFVLEDADGVEARWVSVVLPIIVEESNCLDHISYRQRAVICEASRGRIHGNLRAIG